MVFSQSRATRAPPASASGLDAMNLLHGSGQPRRLALVVDDEPVNRLVLTAMVRHHGFDAIEAANGATALEILGQQRVFVVLLDIHMPGLSGLDVAAALRAGGGLNAEVPVVAVTGDTTRRLADYLAAGFDGYTNKPISMAAVREALFTPRQSAPAQARARSV